MLKEHDTILSLETKILSKKAKVGVIGLGYVGLPFAVEQAKVGFKVTGFDTNADRVAGFNLGKNYISDVDDIEFNLLVKNNLLYATSNMAILSEMDVLVICVPTPLDKNLVPDLSYISSTADHIATHFCKSRLISLESTTYPGTTREVIQTRLERDGLKSGKDFYLAYSPERVDPGNKRFGTKNTNKIVGGTDPESLKMAVLFYEQAIENIVSVSSTEVAEMVKIYENTFRAINIGFVNEIALLCDRMGLNVWEVLDAAFTKPFGIMPFYPGPGVGGHCIPLDPHYLEWKAREYNFQTRFIALASDINRKMPEFVVDKSARILNLDGKSLRGSRILLLGMAYKSNLDDYRESPGLPIYTLLKAAGANVVFHDNWTPYVQHYEIDAHSVELSDIELESADLVILITKHNDVEYERVARLSKRILDTRNVINRNFGNVTLL